MPKKQTKTLKQRLFNKRATAVITVLLIALVGTYILVLARAAENNFPYVNQGFRVSIAENLNAYPIPKGQNFDVGLPIIFDQPKTQSAQTRQVLIMVTADRTKVDYKGFTCGNIFQCHASNWVGKRPVQAQPIREVLCFDVPYNYSNSPDSFTNPKSFFTVHYTSLANPLDYWPNYFAYISGEATGTCESNKSASNAVWGIKIGSCDFTDDASHIFRPCDDGPDRVPSVGSGGGGSGAGNSGNSKGKGTGTGAGGGGGSSATNQDDQNLAIPDSSNQGTNKQTDAEPSPFFDGKLFSSGSDTDNFGLGTASVGGKKIFMIWIYVAILTVLAAAGGYFYWRRKQRSKKRGK